MDWDRGDIPDDGAGKERGEAREGGEWIVEQVDGCMG